MRRAVLVALGTTVLILLVTVFQNQETAVSAGRYLAWSWNLAPDAVQVGTVDVGDTALYYERFGHGPTVVLLHGGATTIESLFAQIPELASRFDVIALDTRGHGRSGRGTRPLTYRQMADDVEQARRVLDA